MKTFFFNIFSGTDRSKKITAELSDFGGRVEADENFIQGACHELLEESLGIFNFLNKDNEIASISNALFTTDRAYIIMLVPIILHCSPDEISKLFQRRRQEIETLDPSKLRHFISKIDNFKAPTLDITVNIDTTWNKDKNGIKSKRKFDFNYLESHNIVYINKDNLIKLLHDDISFLHEEKNKYPELYFAIKDRFNQTDFISTFDK